MQLSNHIETQRKSQREMYSNKRARNFFSNLISRKSIIMNMLWTTDSMSMIDQGIEVVLNAKDSLSKVSDVVVKMTLLIIFRQANLDQVKIVKSHPHHCQTL